MIRISDGLLIIAVVVGAVWTYQIKHEAEVSAREVAKLRSEIAAQENKIVLLEADWAILTSPGRLEKVARDFGDELKLQRIQSSQIATFAELPPLRERPVVEDMQADGDNTIDHQTRTGGIGSLILKNLDVE